MASEDKNDSAYDFVFTSIEGNKLPLSNFSGKILLVVNTASFCGFTNQYEDMQKIWEKYQGKGLVILGVPSNDFGKQEPGTNKDIKNAPVIIEEKETIEARVIRESMSASHALRFHKERLEEEDARDLDARVNDETDDFRVFYLPPPPNKTTTKARNGLSAIAKFAQQRSRTKKKAQSKKNTTSRTDS